MYGMNYSGGDNKTHGQIERTDRIDSFEARERDACGLLMASREGSCIYLRYDRYTEYHGQTEREFVELTYPWGRWRATLELSFVPAGFGGRRAFWLCPRCGKRVRYLYFKAPGFVCRDCAGLNYRSQQRTKSSLNHWRDGMRLATDTLQWRPPLDVVPMDSPYVTPDRPRYMHRTTYRRHLARYRRYQKKYRRDSLREMLAILRL